MTNRKRRDIINELSLRRRVKNRTLKIEQHLSICLKTQVNLFEKMYFYRRKWFCTEEDSFELFNSIRTGNGFDTIYKEFDPGSGRTLAARLTHASRTEKETACWIFLSGGRVSNTWATCPSEWNNVWKRTLIPHNIIGWHRLMIKDLSLRDGLASD